MMVTAKDRTRKTIPPTLEEVQAYCRERNNRVDPQHWMDHYESNGWMVGKTKMKDWQAAVRTWERNDFQGGSRGKPTVGRVRTGERIKPRYAEADVGETAGSDFPQGRTPNDGGSP